MSKIALVIKGAQGRLGQLICKQALDFELLGNIGKEGPSVELQHAAKRAGAGVLIDVSSDLSMDHVADFCVQHRFALVSGVTGLPVAMMTTLDQLAQQVPVLHTANFSVGVAVVKRLMALAGAKLGSEFDLAILDVHHRHKKDAPSGTALGMEQASGRRAQHSAMRLGEVVGEHTASFVSAFERIEIKHSAQDRGVFAAGALRAASWIHQRAASRYSMEDVLQFDD